MDTDGGSIFAQQEFCLNTSIRFLHFPRKMTRFDCRRLCLFRSRQDRDRIRPIVRGMLWTGLHQLKICNDRFWRTSLSATYHTASDGEMINDRSISDFSRSSLRTDREKCTFSPRLIALPSRIENWPVIRHAFIITVLWPCKDDLSVLLLTASCSQRLCVRNSWGRRWYRYKSGSMAEEFTWKRWI